MDKRSESVEDYPEENAANYVNGRFDPKAAEALRASHRKQAEVQANLDGEIQTIAQRHRPQPKG
jgi:hypothetical protein